MANGVYGYTSDSDGYGSIGFGENDTSTHGVLASSTAGYGLVAQGGLAPIRIEPAGTAGAPTSGAHAVGELYVDSGGALYQCITAGSPGTWAQSLLLDQTNTATGTTSVTSTGGTALQGTITSNGTGVAGTDTSTTAGGVGVQGISTKGYGLVAGGGRAPLRLLPASTAGAPTSAAGPHLLGEVHVDSGGVIFQCVAAGTPGTWLRIAAGPVGYAQGALCLLSTPIRVFDSRLKDSPAAPSRAAGPVKGRTSQTLQITGATVAGVSVPAGAVGVVGNLTVVSPTAAGYLTCYPAGVNRPGTPSIDFRPRQHRRQRGHRTLVAKRTTPDLRGRDHPGDLRRLGLHRLGTAPTERNPQSPSARPRTGLRTGEGLKEFPLRVLSGADEMRAAIIALACRHQFVIYDRRRRC